MKNHKNAMKRALMKAKGMPDMEMGEPMDSEGPSDAAPKKPIPPQFLRK